MKFRSALFLGLVALTMCAGCATLSTSDSNGSGLASPSATVPRCVEGTYNRASGMCVCSGG